MPPSQMFTPTLVLTATAESRLVTVACSEACGEPGCASDKVRVTLDRDIVVWEWINGDRIWQVHVFDGNAYQDALEEAASRIVGATTMPPHGPR